MNRGGLWGLFANAITTHTMRRRRTTGDIVKQVQTHKLTD